MITQTHINLLTLLPGQYKHAAQTNGGEYHGPCPFCGGTDRFIVQPNSGNGGHWWCRQCGKSGDSIGFLMQYEALDFKAACERLNVALPDQPTSSPRGKQSPAFTPAVNASDLKDYACFDSQWQVAAWAFTRQCHQRLADEWKTSRAARYLEQRGIDRHTALGNLVGMNPEAYRGTWGSVEVYLPRGITIPWQIDRSLWNIRIRRPDTDIQADGKEKYISATGCANGLYRIDRVLPGDTVIMTEGEFDAMLLGHWLLGRNQVDVSVVSIGSCTGARVVRWITRLALAKKVVIAFDNDSAGNQAAEYWQMALYPKASRLTPVKKDITEMWQSGELPGWIGDLAL